MSKLKVLVLDYGGSAIKYSLMDEKGNQEGRSEVVWPRNKTLFKEATAKIAEEFKGQYDGITVSFPGFVQDNGDLTGGGAYPYYHNHNLNDLFKEITGCDKVVVENDGKCGALAEAWDGPLADVPSGYVIILGSGVGGGLIYERKLIKNKHCTAGELSDVCFHVGQFSYDGTGMCSAKALVNNVAFRKGVVDTRFVRNGNYFGIPLPEGFGPKPGFENVTFDGKLVFKLIEEGDEDALDVYRMFLDSLSTMIINIQTIYAPHRICIGGGISRQERLVPDLKRAYFNIINGDMDPTDRAKLDKGLLPDVFDAEIVSCKHTGDANQFGALYNYLLRFNPELIDA